MRSRSLTFAERMITGTLLSSRTSRSSSRPLSLGSIRSSTITLGGCASIAVSAAWPSAAASTSNPSWAR
jgi:hypothetical protein